MMMVPYSLAASGIHGMGLFAGRAISAGECVWKRIEGFDRVLSSEEVARLPQVKRDWLETYGYRPLDRPGFVCVDADDGRFMNHADGANTMPCGDEFIAVRSIAEGEEITCDYNSFCSEQGFWSPGAGRP